MRNEPPQSESNLFHSCMKRNTSERDTNYIVSGAELHVLFHVVFHRCGMMSEQSWRLTTCLFPLQLEQFWQLEHEVAVVTLEASEVRQHLDTQTVVLADLEAEIKKYNNTLTADQAKMSSFFVTIRQKQDIISNYKQKINNIVAITGVRGTKEPAEGIN